MKFSVKQYAEALWQTLSETSPADQDKVINNFVQILGSNGDLSYYETIIKDFERIDREYRGVKEVEIAVANESQMDSEVVKQLNQTLGNDILLKKKVDESLIGGIVVKVEDTLIDASVKAHLNKLKNNLSQ